MSFPRIALVSLHTSPLDAPGFGDAGGMNVYVSAIADQLAGMGWEVEILTRRANTSDPATARTPGGSLVRFLEAGSTGPVSKEALPALTTDFGAAIARLQPFDLYHSHYWLSAEAALPVALEHRAPHVLSLHTVAALKNAQVTDGQPLEPSARLEAEGRLSAGSDAIITSTRAERHAIARFYEVAPARIVVIEPGVDTALFHPAPVPTAPQDRDDALVVGRIQPLKGQDLAIRAVSLIPARIRPRLLIAGGSSGPDSGYFDDLRRLAAEREVTDDVDFLGPLARSAVAERMRLASLLLVPSTSETYGLVTLEAAASGTPVIASDVPGLAESVVDGRTGVIVRSRDETDWAVTITRLLDDRARLSALSRSAADYGRTKTWLAAAEATSKLYARLLSEAAIRQERR